VRWRLLPLHATCVFRAPLSLIEALISAYPDGPGCVDDQGMLPIHLACRNGASRGVVMTLLNANPRSINVRDKKGRSPLNLVENSNSQNKESVIDAMVLFAKGLEEDTLPVAGTGLRSVSPALPGTLTPVKGGGGGGGLLSTLLSPLSQGGGNANATSGGHRDNAVSNGEREVDYENRTVLFRLVLKKDWDGVASRVHLFPDEACTWIVTKGFNGNLRFLPIHKACVLCPPPTVVASLLSAFPDGASRADQDGWLPLHCACFYGAPDATIDAILRAYPKASARKDDDGRLPLHYACLKGASEYVVNQLLGAHVKGALAKDNDGRMPLHHACSKGASDGVLNALVRLGPKAAQCKDANGRLPLHLACKKGMSKSGLTALLQVYPRGAAAKDDQEKLPVHHACQSGSCSPAAVLALLDAHPESIHARTAFGLTPHDEACQPKSNPELNVGSIVEVLDRFRAEQDRLGLGRDDNGVGGGGIDNARLRELENRVVALTNQTEIMQNALSDIAHIAAQLKSDLALDGSAGSNSTALAKFCDNLMGLSQVSTYQP
jgi:ankyrin repeat protein